MYNEYDLDYTFENDYADLVEYDNLDEDYSRDVHDLESLAYRHYAWYNIIKYYTWFLWLLRSGKYRLL